MPSGAITRSVLSKGNMLQLPTLYSAMRKVTWGGLFPVLLEEEERSPLMVKSAGAVSRVQAQGVLRGSAKKKEEAKRGGRWESGGGGEDEDELTLETIRAAYQQHQQEQRHQKNRSKGPHKDGGDGGEMAHGLSDKRAGVRAAGTAEGSGSVLEERRKVGRQAPRLAQGLRRLRRTRSAGSAEEQGLEE